STLRISHFPDPLSRRYNQPHAPGRAPSNALSRPPVDNRGEPERRTRFLFEGKPSGRFYWSY
ncbi:MAG: hypothetical protein ACREXY_10955, partial [Gammaproteobacteria bacterium]